MPRRTELGKIPAVDLAYALNRLIQEGKTSIAEVRRFAGERPARIAALERELATLKTGHVAARRVGRPPGSGMAAAKPPKRKFRSPTGFWDGGREAAQAQIHNDGESPRRPQAAGSVSCGPAQAQARGAYPCEGRRPQGGRRQGRGVRAEARQGRTGQGGVAAESS